MGINYTPELGNTNFEGYTGQGAFRFWCQHVLPLVYDDSLSYYELLNKVVNYLNNVIKDVSAVETNMDNLNSVTTENVNKLLAAYNQLQQYVNDYFDNLDVQNEINTKLDGMAADGSLSALLGPQIPELVETWLYENVTPSGSMTVVDKTLEISGAGADSKVCGYYLLDVNIATNRAFTNTNVNNNIVRSESEYAISTEPPIPSAELAGVKTITANCGGEYEYRIFFADGSIKPIESDMLNKRSTGTSVIPIPPNAAYCYICLYKRNDSKITTDEKNNITVLAGSKEYYFTSQENYNALNSMNKRIAPYETDYRRSYIKPSLDVIDSNTSLLTTPINRHSIPANSLFIYTNYGYKYRVLFGKGTGTITPIETATSYEYTKYGTIVTIPDCDWMWVCVAKSDDSEIQLNEYNNLKIFCVNTPEFQRQTVAGKKVSFLGDSITTFEGFVPEGNRCRYPQDDLLTNVNQTWWKLLLDENRMTLGINQSWAGSRVSWDGTTESGDIGKDKCISSLARISMLGDNGNPDLIIIYGGTNDIAAKVPIGQVNYDSPKNYSEKQIAELNVNTFADAYRAMLIRVQYYYKDSKIICCLPNYTTSYYAFDEVDKYCEIIKELCDCYGVDVVDLRTCGVTIFNTGDYLPDGIHPNAAGMYLIQQKVNKKLLY